MLRSTHKCDPEIVGGRTTWLNRHQASHGAACHLESQFHAFANNVLRSSCEKACSSIGDLHAERIAPRCSHRQID